MRWRIEHPDPSIQAAVTVLENTDGSASDAHMVAARGKLAAWCARQHTSVLDRVLGSFEVATASITLACLVYISQSSLALAVSVLLLVVGSILASGPGADTVAAKIWLYRADRALARSRSIILPHAPPMPSLARALRALEEHENPEGLTEAYAIAETDYRRLALPRTIASGFLVAAAIVTIAAAPAIFRYEPYLLASAVCGALTLWWFSSIQSPRLARVDAALARWRHLAPRMLDQRFGAPRQVTTKIGDPAPIRPSAAAIAHLENTSPSAPTATWIGAWMLLRKVRACASWSSCIAAATCYGACAILILTTPGLMDAEAPLAEYSIGIATFLTPLLAAAFYRIGAKFVMAPLVDAPKLTDLPRIHEAMAPYNAIGRTYLRQETFA